VRCSELANSCLGCESTGSYLGCELAGSYLGCNTPSACCGPACAGRDSTQNLFYFVSFITIKNTLALVGVFFLMHLILDKNKFRFF